MKKIVALILIIFSITFFAGVVNAQNATTSADRKSEAAQRVKDRFEQLRQRRATISAKIRDTFRRRAHVFGEITAISGTTITIQARRDTVKTIFTNNDTKFLQIGKDGKKKIALADLKVGNKIAAVGIAKDEDSGLAKFVVKLTSPQVRRHTFFGKVSSISGDTLTLVHLIHSDRPAVTVKVNSETTIKIRGKEGAIFADIKVDDKVTASGTVDNSGVITARKLFVIPGKFEGAAPKEATDSATPSATQ